MPLIGSVPMLDGVGDEGLQLREGVLIDQAGAVADSVEPVVVAGHDLAVGGEPEVELDLLRADFSE